MKKFFYLLTLVLTTAMFIACEPNENDWQPDEPQAQNHSFYMNDTGAVHQFTYAFDGGLKSTLGDTVIQYIKFVSYFSRDAGQRNINEIEVYDTAGVNILYGDTAVTHFKFTDNREFNWNDSTNKTYTMVADGNYDMRHRWESFRLIDDGLHMQVDEFTTIMSARLDSIETDSSLTDAERLIKFDSVVNNTVYPDFDTVWFQVNLNRAVNVESIVFYLGEWTQVFDIWVSADGLTWTLLKPEDGYNVIYEK